MIVYYYDSEGFFLYSAKKDSSISFSYSEIEPSESLIKNKWNGTKWIEGANQQQLNEFEKGKVPKEVALWQMMAMVDILGLKEAVLNYLNTLPEPTKSVVAEFLKHGTVVERNSNMINLIKPVINYNDAQMDSLFIQASKIDL